MMGVDPDLVLKMYARGASIIARMTPTSNVYFITNQGCLTGCYYPASGELAVFDQTSYLDDYTLAKFVIRKPIVIAEMFAEQSAS